MSVLASMQVYWTSMLILPLSMTKTMEKMVRTFLWLGGDLVKGKVKVAWSDVCLPKSDGGLGIRPMNLWNNALMTFHTWSIVSGVKKRSNPWQRKTKNLEHRSFPLSQDQGTNYTVFMLNQNLQ
ncbi:hypothetical protein Patl1_07932 [Pistacia atlantica]|uniref:Uncharacterized protein n=1 Tax=Pistacia atlantica TaxID=434234 RepID=A0ACC1AGJ7_9ROSI|nr:hypothetical protein Patl1_07932 [Pistacia atlantica]